jgi:uncharacterized protein YdcH (DUF465 family)
MAQKSAALLKPHGLRIREAGSNNEIQRLTRLHQEVELQLLLLRARRFPTRAEQIELLELKKSKLRLKDRIAWFQAILDTQHNPADE